MSAFSPDVSVLYITLGVLNGTSQVLLYMGSASILYYYFHDKKGLATSIYLDYIGLFLKVFLIKFRPNLISVF